MNIRSIIFYITGVIAGSASLFFLFYTVRLLLVTHGLTMIQSGGNGALIGAFAFPLLSAILLLAAWFAFKLARNHGKRN